MIQTPQKVLPVHAGYASLELLPSDVAFEGEDRAGFEGSVSNLVLTDVVQLQGQNRFSGSIAVSYLDQEGYLYFQDGDIVHADVGSLTGEGAVREIFCWPGGLFSLHPNETGFGRSINKRLCHLLLDVQQWLDDSKSGRVPVPVVPTTMTLGPQDPAMKEAGTMATIAQKLQAVPGVSYAVLMSDDGTLLGDQTSSGESLGAKGIYLATMIARPLSEALGLGRLQVAAIHSAGEQILLLHAKDKYLSVSVDPGQSVDAAEIGIRKILSSQQTEQ